MFPQDSSTNLNRICGSIGNFSIKPDHVDNDNTTLNVRGLLGSKQSAGGGGKCIGSWFGRNDVAAVDDKTQTDNKLDHINTVMNIKVWPLNDNEQINNEKDMVYRLQAICEKINSYFGKKVCPMLSASFALTNGTKLISLSSFTIVNVRWPSPFPHRTRLTRFFIFVFFRFSRVIPIAGIVGLHLLPFAKQQMIFSVLSGFVCITVQLYYLLNNIRSQFRNTNAVLLAFSSLVLIIQHSIELLSTFITAQMVKKKWKRAVYMLQLLKIESNDQKLKHRVMMLL